jgi:hypothetical protein
MAQIEELKVVLIGFIRLEKLDITKWDIKMPI